MGWKQELANWLIKHPDTGDDEPEKPETATTPAPPPQQEQQQQPSNAPANSAILEQQQAEANRKQEQTPPVGQDTTLINSAVGQSPNPEQTQPQQQVQTQPPVASYSTEQQTTMPPMTAEQLADLVKKQVESAMAQVPHSAAPPNSRQQVVQGGSEEDYYRNMSDKDLLDAWKGGSGPLAQKMMAENLR